MNSGACRDGFEDNIVDKAIVVVQTYMYRLGEQHDYVAVGASVAGEDYFVVRIGSRSVAVDSVDRDKCVVVCRVGHNTYYADGAVSGTRGVCLHLEREHQVGDGEQSRVGKRQNSILVGVGSGVE